MTVRRQDPETAVVRAAEAQLYSAAGQEIRRAFVADQAADAIVELEQAIAAAETGDVDALMRAVWRADAALSIAVRELLMAALL